MLIRERDLLKGKDEDDVEIGRASKAATRLSWKWRRLCTTSHVEADVLVVART